MMELEGRVALITGGGRGIGKGCAIELANQGADISIDFLDNREEAEAVAEEVKRLGRRSIALQGDVSVRNDVQKVVEQTKSRLGRLDILVANAGRTVRKPFLELTPEDVAKVWDVSLWGVFHCCQLAAREMVSQGGGSIILISSVHAKLAYRGSFPYTTAKAAIDHMGRILANELAGYRIRVNVVEPGWTDTPGERTLVTEEFISRIVKSLPFQRMATIEEIGRGVAFLASDKTSYITGTTLVIDGGWKLPGELPGFMKKGRLQQS
jgi:glucose 1-dehydrogenase